MDVDDLLARIQQRGRLHGRNESRRAVCAVVETLGEFLSVRAFHLLAEQLPEDIRRQVVKPTDPVRPVTAPTCRTFLSRIERRLYVDGPDATFTARVVLEQLNATRRVITPAAFAHLVAPDLRPLLSARPLPEPPADQLPSPRRLIRVPSTTARPTPVPLPATAARPAPAPATPARPALAATRPVPATTRPVPAINARPIPATAARSAPATAARPSPATTRPAPATNARSAPATNEPGRKPERVVA